MTDDQTLMLYYYDDGLSAAERERVEAALRSDPLLARRYQALREQLQHLEVRPGPTAPPDAVVRWHHALDQAALAEDRARRARVWPGIAAAAVLVLGVGIGIGLWLADERPAGSGELAATPGVTSGQYVPGDPVALPNALTRGMTAHLRRTQQQLETLNAAGAQQRRELIAGILEQNRLFERAAERSGEPQLARLLRGFEQILLTMGGEQSTQDIASQREQLQFELAVTLTKLSRQSSERAYDL